MVKRIFTVIFLLVTVMGCLCYYYSYQSNIQTLGLLMMLVGFGVLVAMYEKRLGFKIVSYEKGKNPLRPEVLKNIAISLLIGLTGGTLLFCLTKLKDKRTERIMNGPTAIVNATVVKVDSSSARNRGRYYINIIEYPTAKGIIRQDIETEGEWGFYQIGTQIPVRYSLAYPDIFRTVQEQ